MTNLQSKAYWLTSISMCAIKKRCPKTNCLVRFQLKTLGSLRTSYTRWRSSIGTSHKRKTIKIGPAPLVTWMCSSSRGTNPRKRWIIMSLSAKFKNSKWRIFRGNSWSRRKVKKLGSFCLRKRRFPSRWRRWQRWKRSMRLRLSKWGASPTATFALSTT